MSSTFATTERHSFTTFYGGDANGPCLQITSLSSLRHSDDEGYVSFTLVEAAEAAYQIMRWVKEETERRRSLLRDQIEKLKLDEKNIFREVASFDESVVACEINRVFVRLVDATCPKRPVAAVVEGVRK